MPSASRASASRLLVATLEYSQRGKVQQESQGPRSSAPCWSAMAFSNRPLPAQVAIVECTVREHSRCQCEWRVGIGVRAPETNRGSLTRQCNGAWEVAQVGLADRLVTERKGFAPQVSRAPCRAQTPRRKGARGRDVSLK